MTAGGCCVPRLPETAARGIGGGHGRRRESTGVVEGRKGVVGASRLSRQESQGGGGGSMEQEPGSGAEEAVLVRGVGGRGGGGEEDAQQLQDPGGPGRSRSQGAPPPLGTQRRLRRPLIVFTKNAIFVFGFSPSGGKINCKYFCHVRMYISSSNFTSPCYFN